MEWQNKEIDLGNLEPNKEYPFNFLYMGNSQIMTVKPACGCTAAKVEDNIISGIYKSGAFPQYAKSQGFADVKVVKSIDVITNDNKKHKLTIKGHLYDI